jgi:anti-sigma B factor antagonist
MTRQVRYKGRRMQIAGELTVYTATALYAEVLAALDKSARIEEMDLSAVTEIDTAGLQILLLARRSAQAAHRQLQVANPSPAVSGVLELLQLQDFVQGTPEAQRAP